MECNPRPTNGVALMSTQMFVGGVMDADSIDHRLLEAGLEEQINVAIVRNMIKDWKQIPSNIQALSSLSYLYFRRNDIMPALYQFLSYSHIRAFLRFLRTKKRKRTDIIAAQLYDIY